MSTYSILRNFSSTSTEWNGERVSDSMLYVESLAQDGYLSNIYTFKTAQILLDSLEKTIKLNFNKLDTFEYYELQIKRNDNEEYHIIGDNEFRYFIMTEYIDQLNTHLKVLNIRLNKMPPWKKLQPDNGIKLEICIDGIKKYYNQLTDVLKWNYILCDIKILMKNILNNKSLILDTDEI